MPELRTYIHTLEFNNEFRSQISLSGEARLDPKLSILTIKKDANGDYDTGDTNIAISQPFAPGARRAWAGLTANLPTQFPDTSISYRISNGVDQFHWNGSAWVVNVVDWNTEQELNVNLAAFTHSTLRIVMKLKTTDTLYAPFIPSISIAWTGQFSWWDDIIHRSLIPRIRTIQVETDFAVKAPAAGTAINVKTVVASSGYQFIVTAVPRAYNTTTDPTKQTNIAGAYNSGTGALTLTTAVALNDVLWLELVITPAVAATTSQDYIEVETVPAFVISNIQTRNAAQIPQTESVVNKATNAALIAQHGYRADINFSIIIMAAGAVDLAKMVSSMIENVTNNPLLTSAATGRQHRLWMLNGFSQTTRPSRNDLHTAQADFVIKDVTTVTATAQAGWAVGEINLLSNNNRSN